LIIRTINTASIGLTVPIEAVNKAKDKTTICIEAVEGAYIKKINNIKKTREQDSCRRDAIFIIN
jgi:tRNA A22 N-methylase